MSTEAAQASQGQPFSGTPAKGRLKRTGSCAAGEPFGSDSAIAGSRRGASETAVRKTKDEDCIVYMSGGSGEVCSVPVRHVCTLFLIFYDTTMSENKSRYRISIQHNFNYFLQTR